MDNYVDCSQCPGIYDRLPAIYDRWRHQWELVNDMKQADLSLSTPISDLYFTWNLAKKFSADQFREECSRMCLFLQAGNICNSLKNFPRYFSNFSQLMMFISLAVCRVLIRQTMKKDERLKIPGWKKRINMVSLAVLSLANCKFSKNAQNENWPRPSWGGDHGNLLQFPSQIQFSFKFITILKAF